MNTSKPFDSPFDKGTAANTVNTVKNSVWFCLNFPNLPVEIFTRGQDPEAQQPVVVLERARVGFLNQQAADIGIRPGSNMNTAYTISEQVASFDRNEERELATLQQLAQWAYQFSPNVAIRPPHSLLIDVTGCLKLFRGIRNLKQLIKNGTSKLGFQVQTGINHTPLAALCMAEAGITDIPASAEGEQVQTSDCVRETLAAIPVVCLRVDEKAVTSLHQMGIQSCRQLFALPVDGLNRRFGVFFTDYLQRLTGEKADPQKFISAKPHFFSDVTFLSDVNNTESLVFPIKRLLGELNEFLTGRQLLVNQFTFKLSHRNHPPRSFTIYLAGPDNDAGMFLMLSQLQLEKINDMPEIDNISLAARQFFDSEAASGDLFHGTRFQQKDGRTHSKADEARAVRLINMMTARLGPQACFGLSEANDHRPECAWKPVRLATRDYWQPSEDTGGSGFTSRPLYLLPKPRQLKVKNGEPCLSGSLELLQGPERIDFGWWDATADDNRAVSRDYYIARHESGPLYWVYRRLDHDRPEALVNQEWYLHGIFS